MTLSEAISQFIESNCETPIKRSSPKRKNGCKITLNKSGKSNRSTFRYSFFDQDTNKYMKYNFVKLGYGKADSIQRIDFMFFKEKPANAGRIHVLSKNAGSCFTTEIPQNGEKAIRKCINRLFEMVPYPEAVSDDFAWYYIDLSKEEEN